MAAGGPGDHPLSDALDFKLKVYGEECDQLINEMSKYASREEMLGAFDWFNEEYLRNLSKFALILRSALEKMIDDRKARGWEV
jgi:hypothetical protein